MFSNTSSVGVKAYEEYLKAILPQADLDCVPADFCESVAAHCVKVRAEMPWGREIPEPIFRTYVLFPRVNDEDLVFYHERLHDWIMPHLPNASEEQAVQEINFLCFEQVVYRASDDRTANALTTLKRGCGRCGEESVLSVCALRACGIPARQVYVPRWAHCDDNHAWVEFWMDGTWHYLGACEPEPVLDSGWFTAAASKAMLVHTRAYGEIPDDASVIRRDGCSAVLNCTARYAPTRIISVIVSENGVPAEGICVRFELLNMAEFFPICELQTNREGAVQLELGLGTIHLHIHNGQRFTCRTVRADEDSPIRIDFSKAVVQQTESACYSQQPPEENRIQPHEFPEDLRNAFQIRMEKAQTVQQSNLRCKCTEQCSVGERFLRSTNDLPLRMQLLSTLREKDFADVTCEVLEDALAAARGFSEQYPEDVQRESVLCPRIADEMLYPDRMWLRNRFRALTEPSEIWNMLEQNWRIVESRPLRFPRIRCAVESGGGTLAARDLAFVAICRALGIAARLNPASQAKEVWQDGRYRALIDSESSDCAVTLNCEDSETLHYGVDFTIGKLENGAFRTLKFDGRTLRDSETFLLPAGTYRIITCTRQIDGSADAVLHPAVVHPSETKRISLRVPPKRTEELVRHIPLPPLKVDWHDESIFLPECIKPAILACIAPGQEPTEHFLNELLAAKNTLAARRIAIDLVVNCSDSVKNEKLQRVSEEVKRVCIMENPDTATLMKWHVLFGVGDLRPPFAAAINRKGEGLCAFANYNVGTVMTLIRIIEDEERKLTWTIDNGFKKPVTE